MKNIIAIVLLCILLIGAGSIFMMYVNYNNSEIALRKQVEGQKQKTEAIFDNMWKVLKSKASVTDQYKNAFAEIFPALIAGRYSKGDGSLMKWVQEQNPSFDVSLYKDLMRSIEIERQSFINEQEVLIDMGVQHDIMISQIPGKWFISNTTPIKIIVIKSSRTNEAYSTGEENDFELFNKPVADSTKK